MTSFWERLLGRKDTTSAQAARERLKLVLVTDRSELSPERLAQMQAEIIGVIKRYMNIDDAEVKIKLEQRARDNYLVADIPLVRNTSALEAVVLGEDPPADGKSAPVVSDDVPAVSDLSEEALEDAVTASETDSSEVSGATSDAASDETTSSQDTSPTPPRKTRSK